MSEKHTPGPWLLEDRTVYALNERGQNRFSASVQDAHAPAYELIANARLMSAAPDLLDALECLKRELILSDVDMGYIESHFRPWLNKAESAVAKARGYLFSPMPDKARGAS